MTDKIFKIIIFGVQGAGKGTQAEMISAEYGVCWISPGNIFRHEIKKQSELGKKAEIYLKEGKLVPDEVTNEIIKKRITESDCQGRGYVLDGYPRNLGQAGFLDNIDEMTHILNITISDEEAPERMLLRRICPKCGGVYNLKFKKPRRDEFCDECGERLKSREDDTAAAIKERLNIYHGETEPLLGFYRAKGILYEINGEQAIEKVFEDIEKVLK